MIPFSVAGLTSIFNQLLPEPHAGLLAGLLFGTKATLSKELYDALVTSGTIHIIALSGMNITIIIDIIAKTLLPVIGKRYAAVVTLIGIIWFVWFVGPSSTIIRAAIMGGISLISVLFGRQYWAILSWTLAIGIMLLIHVSWLFEMSFQLSAMATLGIILFRQKTTIDDRVWKIGVEDRASKIEESNLPSIFYIRQPLSMLYNLAINNLHLTLAAQVFTIPIIMLYFHRISLISPLSNLAIGWLIGPLTMLGWATAIAGWIWLPLGQMIAWFDWALLQYLTTVVVWTSRIPFASLSL